MSFILRRSKSWKFKWSGNYSRLLCRIAETPEGYILGFCVEYYFSLIARAILIIVQEAAWSILVCVGLLQMYNHFTQVASKNLDGRWQLWENGEERGSFVSSSLSSNYGLNTVYMKSFCKMPIFESHYDKVSPLLVLIAHPMFCINVFLTSNG